ncbi:MAG: hypothetical protein AMXMBFR33_44110 [Candidatus Xenobia bacterium]
MVSGRLSGHGHIPFTEVFPSLPHRVPEAIAPLVESLRTDNRGRDLTGVDWLGLALAVEAAGCAAVLAFGSDDEGLDFAFQVSQGKLERFLSRPEEERLISYRSSCWQTTAGEESKATVLELWPRQQLALAKELGIGTLDFHFRAPLIFERGPIPGELQQPPPEERLPRLVAEKDLAGALALLRATPDLPSRGRKLQALRDAVCSEVAGQCRQALERGHLGLLQEALALVGEHPAEPELLPLWNRLQLSLGEAYLAAGQASRALEPLRGVIRLTGMVTEEHQVMARARELRPVAARQACSQLGVQASPTVEALLADTQTSLETLTEALSSEETAWDCPRGVYAFENPERGLFGRARFAPASVEPGRSGDGSSPGLVSDHPGPGRPGRRRSTPQRGGLLLLPGRSPRVCSGSHRAGPAARSPERGGRPVAERPSRPRHESSRMGPALPDDHHLRVGPRRQGGKRPA